MSSRVIDGRKFEKKWMQKAKQKFGLNRKGVISLMKKAGIKNLNSSNDIRGMKRHAERRPAPSGGGKTYWWTFCLNSAHACKRA